LKTWKIINKLHVQRSAKLVCFKSFEIFHLYLLKTTTIFAPYLLSFIAFAYSSGAPETFARTALHISICPRESARLTLD